MMRGRNTVARCGPFSANRGTLPEIPATPATVARTRLDKWRRDNPQTDSKILPRVPRNKGGQDQGQKALNHSDMKTTTRYAHVLPSEAADAMQRLAQSQAHTKSRKKSRSEVVNQ